MSALALLCDDILPLTLYYSMVGRGSTRKAWFSLSRDGVVGRQYQFVNEEYPKDILPELYVTFCCSSPATCPALNRRTHGRWAARREIVKS